ncbi:MAG: translation initiation factor IF-3, partial [Proteobacteria bacterium]|nr:translation initiation factor IF-3 [Pseudomonadota bacterium]
MAKRVNVNRSIRASTVRLIGNDGEQMGIMALDQALSNAEEQGLDLVEVAPGADPPVCRIMDYGKYKYQQNKKVKEARKKSSSVQIKEVKFRPKTDDHDVDTKIGHAKRFLAKGHKLKLTIMFRGRELAHPHLGEEMLRHVSELLAEEAIIESGPSREGRHMSLIMAPRASAQAPKTPTPVD